MAGSFFSSCQAISTYDSKNHSLILDLEPNFQRNTLPGNMHGIPTDTNMRHRRMEPDRPLWSRLLAYQATSSSMYIFVYTNSVARL